MQSTKLDPLATILDHAVTTLDHPVTTLDHSVTILDNSVTTLGKNSSFTNHECDNSIREHIITDTSKVAQSDFEKGIAKFYSACQLRRLQQVVVGILGAGGLGSNCAVHLARSGVRHFIISDFDRVDMSNLNRQYFFPHQVGDYKVHALRDILCAINPNVEVIAYTEPLTPHNIYELYQEAHILIEAFDNPHAKDMFIDATQELNVPKIMVSGLGGIGHSDDIQIKRLGSNLYIIGDGVSDINLAPPYAPRVAIAAAKQADVALSLLLQQ